MALNPICGCDPRQCSTTYGTPSPRDLGICGSPGPRSKKSVVTSSPCLQALSPPRPASCPADRDPRRGQALDDRPRPAQFFRRGDALRHPGGCTPAHVHDVLALVHSSQPGGPRPRPNHSPRPRGVGGDGSHAHTRHPSRVGKPRGLAALAASMSRVTLRGHLLSRSLARRSGPPRARLYLSRDGPPERANRPARALRSGRVAHGPLGRNRGPARRHRPRTFRRHLPFTPSRHAAVK